MRKKNSLKISELKEGPTGGRESGKKRLGLFCYPIGVRRVAKRAVAEGRSKGGGTSGLARPPKEKGEEAGNPLKVNGGGQHNIDVRYGKRQSLRF